MRFYFQFYLIDSMKYVIYNRLDTETLSILSYRFTVLKTMTLANLMNAFFQFYLIDSVRISMFAELTATVTFQFYLIDSWTARLKKLLSA